MMKKAWYKKGWIWAAVIIVVALGAIYENMNTPKAASSKELKQNAETNNNANNKENTNDTTKQPPLGNTNSKDFNNIDTTTSPFEKGYYDYQGTIGKNMPIQMSIYPLGKDIVGSYFYETQRKKLELKGKAGSKEIILYEYDEAGKNLGRFEGVMNTVDKIEGTWVSADDKKNYPFKISLRSNLPGTEYGKRYQAVTTYKSDQEVEEFVSKIQSYVINSNRKQLADEVMYPIKVKHNDNGKSIMIQNNDDFIKNYDEIFYPKYKQIISNSFTKYLFVNGEGIMFGARLNNIWINEMTLKNGTSKLMITSINN